MASRRAGSFVSAGASRSAGASGSDNPTLASGSFETRPPPANWLEKPCPEGKGWVKEYHKWSWTKAAQGARVEMKSGEWHHWYLAHQLCRHGLVVSIKPVRSKLLNSQPGDHESDTNYYCWFADPDADPKLAPGSKAGGWAATFGYSRFKDRKGNTHGWVQFGKNCTQSRQKNDHRGDARVFWVPSGQRRECSRPSSAKTVLGSKAKAAGLWRIAAAIIVIGIGLWRFTADVAATTSSREVCSVSDASTSARQEGCQGTTAAWVCCSDQGRLQIPSYVSY